MVWTSNGRPHPAVLRTLCFAAELAANRSDRQVSAASLQARWRHEIQVAILRRRAAMMRSVLPRAGAAAEWLLTGHTCGPPTSDYRANPLTGDGEPEPEYEHESDSDAAGAGTDAASDEEALGGGAVQRRAAPGSGALQ